MATVAEDQITSTIKTTTPPPPLELDKGKIYSCVMRERLSDKLDYNLVQVNKTPPTFL